MFDNRKDMLQFRKKIISQNSLLSSENRDTRKSPRASSIIKKNKIDFQASVEIISPEDKNNDISTRNSSIIRIIKISPQESREFKIADLKSQIREWEAKIMLHRNQHKESQSVSNCDDIDADRKQINDFMEEFQKVNMKYYTFNGILKQRNIELMDKTDNKMEMLNELEEQMIFQSSELAKAHKKKYKSKDKKSFFGSVRKIIGMKD